MLNLTLNYIALQFAHVPRTLNFTTTRDVAAAAWSLLALSNANGALNATVVEKATAAIDAVLAAQLPSGEFPWSFKDGDVCTDQNAVQFVTLPLSLAVVHFGAAIGDSTVKRWLPNLRLAAIASFAEGATNSSEAQPFYTNIFTMRIVNLLLLAQISGNATVRAQADAALDTWESLVRGAGVHEYVSPTYTAVAIHNIFAGASAVSDAGVATRLRALADFMMRYVATFYFAPSVSMAGPHSRDYDFVSGAAGMDWVYALSGIANSSEVDAFASNADPITNTELFTLYVRGEFPPASPAALALAVKPSENAWRTVRTSFLPVAGHALSVNGEDATLFVGASSTLGTSSSYYGAQDKMVNAAVGARGPQITFVQDMFDSPYGTVKTPDGSGHEKPTHLKATVGAVQDGALALILNDLTMSIESTSHVGPFSSLAANVIFPAGTTAAVFVDGVRLTNVSHGAPSVPLRLDATVAVQAGGGAVVFRVPFVDGLLDYKPRAEIHFDGPPGSDAARLATYLYEGPNATFAANPPPSRSILVIGAAEASTDEDVARLCATFGALNITNLAANSSNWRVFVTPPPSQSAGGEPPGFASTLEAALWVPYYKKILARRINGTDLTSSIPDGGVVRVTFSNSTVVNVTL